MICRIFKTDLARGANDVILVLRNLIDSRNIYLEDLKIKCLGEVRILKERKKS